VSLTSITEHHRKWEALPAFPDYPYVMTDDDVNAWSDLLYMRSLVNDIVDMISVDGARIAPAGWVEFDVDLYLDPWPNDVAGMLIESWKAEA
jgi:hypothetical protein